MTEGKRILFAIPWGERTVLGTTDTDYQGSLEHVCAEAKDISYVLDVANGFFPTAKLNPQDVINTWAGVRPLIADSTGRPSDISRSHEIKTPEPGWWDVAGGKLTTYRLMAEQTVDRIVHWLREAGRLKVPVQDCRTAEEMLLPPAETEGVSAILPPEVSRKAVEHYCVNEWAIHLDDLMIRRTTWHYYHPDAPEIAKQVGAWMREILGWSEDVHDEEIARYQRAGCHDSENSGQVRHWQLTRKTS
jgi:glycerol-3-phosphate dehydrogenase